jgi:hypothetical protein
MRNNILLLSAAILLGACADDQHATAPAGPQSAAAIHSIAPDVPVTGNGKPNAPSGWTTAVTVFSTPHAVAAGSAGFATATCPAGTTLVGGGYSLDFGNLSVAPAVYLNNPGIGSTGWNAGVRNFNPVGGVSVSITAYARCAS